MSEVNGLIHESKLAIAASSFDKPSETFIRAHLAHILPGKTVTICWPDSGLSRTPLSDAEASLTLTPPKRGLLSYVLPPFSQSDHASAVKFLTDQGVTAVLAEFGPASVQMINIARDANCRLLAHFHGVDASKRLRNPLARRQYRRLFGTADAIIAPSKFLIDRLIKIGCPPPKTHVIPCGVDASAFSTSERIPGRAIAVGRLVDKKDPVTTIRAFAKAAQEFPEAHLDLIGDGPLLGDCQKAIAAAGAGTKITLHGALPHEQVREIMASATLFLQHSITPPDGNSEGMPVSLLEAMASGLGIITTRHAGIPEAITDGVEGLLTDEGDEDGMATAIAALFANPKRAKILGEAAQKRCRVAFTQEITNGKLRKLVIGD